MFSSESIPLTLEEAHHLLKQFDCGSSKPTPAQAQRQQLRQALQRIASQSDHQLLGICADTLTQGQQALQSYASALGYSPILNAPDLKGAVYIKFNPNSGLCYADSYTGESRGVLVSCQSADESGINEMYGHLPLDLFSNLSD